eukprot:TRINITY_DN90971_c0_g1_i1.p1 TRINITY_DN90971_c0_g1~~TRINITY_DN90971_c0_g1_i1.p1  ORF type:complete len:358 (+),score=83.27 TRINITY_DN90971_c0_g1_i1:102-1175(+)
MASSSSRILRTVARSVAPKPGALLVSSSRRVGSEAAALTRGLAPTAACAVRADRCFVDVALPSLRQQRPQQRRRFAAATASGGGSADFEKQLMPEDILHLRATSMSIMQDPVCELRPEEVNQYLLERGDPVDELPMWHPTRWGTKVTQPFRSRNLATVRLTELIIERLDNEPLCDAFAIDHGFNMQVYFMIIHAWLLHQRLVLEKSTRAKKIDEAMFESCWTLVRNWLVLKKVPEYRFDAELMNVQEYMLGCCIHLDKALERPDILPARLQQVLWANVYSGGVKRDAAQLTLLTKYCLRQLGLMMRLPAENFLSGNFVWADFPLPSDGPPRRTALPLWKEEFRKAMAEAREQVKEDD